MKKILTSALILLSVTLFAQNRFDVFYAGGNYNFIGTTDANPNENYDGYFMTNLSVPIVLKDSSIWFTSIDYQYFSTTNEYLASTVDPIKQFHLNGFMLRTGYVYRIDSKRSLQILFVPRSMADVSASFSNSIQLGGMLMYEKVKNKDYTWRVGAIYNNEFFGTYIVPIFYLDWNMTSKIKVKGLLPIYGKVYMEPNENVDIGLHFIGLTTSHRINEPGYENAYVERKTIDISAFGNFHLFDNIFMEARAGYSISRDYGLYAEDDKVDLGLPLVNIGDDRTRLNEEFGGGAFVHLRLIYSIPVD
ncbi:MAG: hypothetical protein KQH79_00980 [Bacteroidetes bacterium]|nr:hypothetical protein [Bacteroidota bacterium]